MVRFWLRLWLGREMADNLLWVRENPDLVFERELASWEWAG